MDRPDGRSPFPPTNQMTQSFITSSTSNHRPSALQAQPTNQHNLSFNYSLIPFPSPSLPDFKSDQQSSPSLLLDNTDYPLGDDFSDLESQTFHSLQANSSFDLGSFASVSHAPRVSPHRPWNPVNASMTPHFDQSPSELEPSEKKLHTDSGYASSQKSRQIFATHSLPFTSFEASLNSTYDEPIDSTAQQNFFLPEQQHRKPPSSIVTSTSPKVPSFTIVEELPTSSTSQSFLCEECLEKFNTKSEMSKHMARHEKKYTCGYANCPRGSEGFATKNDLDRHKASVHRDPDTVRKEYKCCVPGCKDPNKVWDRKDNFKAHVKRMHPEVDIDKTIADSYQKQISTSNDPAQPQTNSLRPDQMMANQMQPSLSAAYNQPPMRGPEYNTSYYGGSPTVLGEDDAYDHSVIQGPRQSQNINYMRTVYNNNAAFTTSSYPPPATIGSLAYATSHVMAPTNSMHDGRPIMSYRNEFLGPNSHGECYVPMNHARPYDTRTAPPGNDPEDFMTYANELGQRGGNASVVDVEVPAMDPVQQTTQSGSWDQSSQFFNYPVQTAITDQGLNSNLNFLTDEPATPDSNIQKHKTKVYDKVMAIFKQLPPDQAKSMITDLRNDFTAPDEDKDTLQKLSKPIEHKVKAGFPCTRDGCSKSFTQKNIRTKHEQRHDRLFFCTFDGCYSTFGSKDDLIRHERRKHEREAFQGWRCFTEDCPSSQHKLECSRFFGNEEQFKKHRRDVHHERAKDGVMKAARNCHVLQGMPGPFWCGFCKKVLQNDPSHVDGTKQEKFRYDHIDYHVKKEKLKIDAWVDLKSEGLGKSMVKDRNPAQTNVEDSQEEEEQDELTVQASNTVGNTLSHGLTPSSQRWVPPSSNGRGKKRALSNAELNASMPATKMPRLAAYQQRQAPSMSQAMTAMPSTQSTLFASDNHHRRSREVGVIQCCQCDAQRFTSDVMSCGNNGCYHNQCDHCTYQSLRWTSDNLD